MAGNMVQRVLFALVAIPLALTLVWLGGAALTGLVMLAGVLGTRELLQMGRQRGIHADRTLAWLAAAGLPLAAWRTAVDPSFDFLAFSPHLLALWVILVLTVTLIRVRPDRHPLAAAGLTLLAPLYAGGLPAFLLVLRHGAGHPERSWAGLVLVLFPLALTWLCDSAAMEIGRRVGGPRLAPVVSPGKTWSGTIGGFLAAAAAGPLFATFVARPAGIALSAWQALALGVVVGVMGQVGDLAESLFKREAGMKDSSHLLPGHGGVLDRLDSLYFVLPLTAVLYEAFGVL